MEKKMVYELPNPFTYTAPTDHNDMSLPKIIQGKDFSYNCQQAKKAIIKGTLVNQTLI